MANLHPLIDGTVAQWDLQNSFADSGPNGLDLSEETINTGAFVTMDGDLFGYKFRDTHVHNNSVLVADDSPLFRFTSGNQTIEWLGIPLSTTGTQVLFEVATGIGSSYYAIYIPSGTWAYADNHTGAFSMSPVGGGGFVDQGTIDVLHHYAIRMSNAAGVVTVSLFIDGVLTSNNVVTIPKTWAGTERFRVGGEYPGATLGTDWIIGSLRVLDYARSDLAIASDAYFTLFADAPVEDCTPFIHTDGVVADANQLVVTFSAPVVLSGPALDAANWTVSLSGPGRAVQVTSVDFTGDTVTLGTTAQTLDATYTLNLPTLGITSDEFGIFTGLYSLDFLGVPTIVNVQMVRAVDTHHVDVIFATPVTEESAGDPTNYSVDGGLTVTEAVRVTDYWYRLRNEPRQTDGVSYTFTATNIEAK